MGGDPITGVLLGLGVGQVYKEAEAVANQIADFDPNLDLLGSTHESIKPKLEEIVQLNRRLDMPEEELSKFIDKMKEGEKLVQKCAKIKWWNLIKRYSYSRKLDDLNNSMLRFFQVDMQADIYRDSKRILSEVRQSLEISRNGNSLKGAVGWCEVPEVPEFVVGLELPLRDLKVMLLKEENPDRRLCTFSL